MYFYSESVGGKFDPSSVWRMNGSEAYLRHFDNFLFLDFIAKNGTRAERAQVEKEIIICKRKLSFWEKHPNFDAELVAREKARKIKDWKSK